jgi:hypothetical protein
MGNTRKQLFFGPTLYPQITCSLCSSTKPDTWKHVLLSCTQQHLHALQIKLHNKATCEFRFPLDSVTCKINKYTPLLQDIQARGWQVAPLMVLTAGARATTHLSTMTILYDTLKIPKSNIKQTCTNINIIAIHHAMSILLHKRKLENNQPLPNTHNHP